MIKAIVILSAVGLSCAGTASSAEKLHRSPSQANEVIVKLQTFNLESKNRILELADGDSLRAIGDSGLFLLHSRSADVDTLLARLHSDPNVVRVEPNIRSRPRVSPQQESRSPEPDRAGILRQVAKASDWSGKLKLARSSAEEGLASPGTVATLMPNDSYVAQQWAVRNIGQPLFTIPSFWSDQSPPQIADWVVGKPGADAKVAAAWAVTTGSRDIVVALLDSGISYDHPDLAANIWRNPGGIGGCPKGTHGFDVIPGSTTPCDPFDYLGHGTSMAGVVGAVGNNGVGIAGMNWKVTLMEIKVGVTWDTIAADIAGIYLAIEAKKAGVNVRVITAPLGWSAPSESFKEAILEAGENNIVFVAASGNDGLDISPDGSDPTYPASWNLPNLISVAATDSDDQLWVGSNYGRESVHLGAPGDAVVSTFMNAEYGYFCCTSAATATVGGAVALVLSAPGMSQLSAIEVKNRILATVDPLSSLALNTQTGGRLNVCSAIPGCSQALPKITLTPTQVSFSKTGGDRRIAVSVRWPYPPRTDSPSWISIMGLGFDGFEIIAAANNTGISRLASIWLAGQTISISQSR